MNRISKVRIGNLGQIITGKTPSSDFPNDFGLEYMFVTPSDSFDQKMMNVTERYLSNEGVQKLSNKLLPPKSIMVTCIGSAMGKVSMNKSSGITNQQINSIVTNKDHDSDYIYYAIKNNYRILRNASTGSTALPILNKTDFELLEIPIHSEKETQKKAAFVLSALDSKIELNNRINAELEAMAKTLYDYWFVQFDFPDANGKPYKESGGKMVWSEELKREIPEGWEVGTLLNLGEIIGGSTPPREVDENFTSDGTAWITPKDLSLNSGKKFITKGELDASEKGIKAASLNIMPRGTILLSSRAPIGYLAISRDKVTTNQGFKSFVPNKGFSTEFVYYSIKNMIPAIQNNAVGSTFKEVSATTLKSIPVWLPNKAIVRKYTDSAINIFKRQDLLELENQQLSSLRDWLLPMLMNGQVKVGGSATGKASYEVEEELRMAAEPENLTR